MKKLKSLLFILGAIALVILFGHFCKINSFVGSASAVSHPTTQFSNVTFYGSNRLDSFYQVDSFYNGYNLSSNNNNVLENSSFYNYSSSSEVYTNNNAFFFSTGLDYWLGSRSFSYNINNGLLYITSINNSIFTQEINVDNMVVGSTIYLSVLCDGQLYNFSAVVPSNNDTVWFSAYQMPYPSNGLAFRLGKYSDEVYHFDFYPSAGSYSISYFYLRYDFDIDYYDYNYLKYLYNQTLEQPYNDVTEFELNFTTDYYEYSQYFDNSYVVSQDTNIYCVDVPVNQNDDYISSQNYNVFSSSSDIFTNNLLNDINQSAINIEYNYLHMGYQSGFTGSMRLTNLVDGYVVGNNFTSYTDLLGNTFYFFVDVLYGQYDNTNMYFYSFYLYDCVIENQKLVVPSFPYSDFIETSNNVFYFPKANLTSNESVMIGNTILNFSFDIDYNMQYYYSNNFGVKFDISNYASLNNVKIDFISTNNKIFRTSALSGYTFNNYNVLTSDYLLNSYINKINVSLSALPSLNTSYNSSSINTLLQDLSNDSLTFSLGTPAFYFNNTEEDTSSSIIPTTSSGLYKEKTHWYDFSTDLYNFVIYLFFDAPIVSNITSLVYVIISLMIKVIELIISLFSSLGSTIFISAILGFMLFKFIVKKFLGGE